MVRSICLVVAACVCSVSHAGYVVVDDFNDLLNNPAEATNDGNNAINQLKVFNPNATVFTGPASTSTSDTGSMLGGQRDATFSIVNTPPANENTSVAFIGSSQLAIQNGSTIDAELTLVYDAGGAGLNQSLTDTSLFRFTVVSSDISTFDLSVTVYKQSDATTASTGTASFSTTTGGATFFDIDFGSFSLATGGTTEFDFASDLLGKVEVSIGGLPGYDINLDSIEFTTPEPGTAVGIAAIGVIGLMTRRKRRA